MSRVTFADYPTAPIPIAVAPENLRFYQALVAAELVGESRLLYGAPAILMVTNGLRIHHHVTARGTPIARTMDLLCGDPDPDWLADRRTGEARELLERARSGWDERRRLWEGTWARLDLARVAQRARRPGEQARLLNEARERAAAGRMPVFAARAASLSAGGPAGRTELGPLSAREFEVAQLVAEGATNREIAERLFMSPKTASAHIEHILAKLKVARRSEIAAWVARGG